MVSPKQNLDRGGKGTQYSIIGIFSIFVGIILGFVFSNTSFPEAIFNFISNLSLVLLTILVVPRILAGFLVSAFDINGYKVWLRIIFLQLQNTVFGVCLGALIAYYLYSRSNNPSQSCNFNQLQEISINNSFIKPIIIAAILLIVFFGIGLALSKLRQNEVFQKTKEDVLHIARKAQFVYKEMLWIFPTLVLANQVYLFQSKPHSYVAFEFVIAILIGHTIQIAFYVSRLILKSKIKLRKIFLTIPDVLLISFLTSSTYATIPVTYEVLTEKLKLSEKTTSAVAIAGTNLNNDGGSMYLAVCILFELQQETNCSLSSILVSPDGLLQLLIRVGAVFTAPLIVAGFPKASVNYLQNVLQPLYASASLQFIPHFDLILDRFRTVVNILGDVTVAIIVDESELKNKNEETRKDVT